MKKIKNKYILKCFGTFHDEENHYIILEYAEKGDLNKVIIQILVYC
jgi:serine/threonine protein kinase